MPTIQKTIRIFEFIKRYHASNGVAPTMAEIARQFQFNSITSVVNHLKKMEDQGWIRRTPNVSRGITLTEQQTEAV
jgi:SOS-response transcriptional repressor LexA